MSGCRTPALGIPIYISVFERRLEETSLFAHNFRYITMTEKGLTDAKYARISKASGILNQVHEQGDGL